MRSRKIQQGKNPRWANSEVIIGTNFGHLQVIPEKRTVFQEAGDFAGITTDFVDKKNAGVKYSPNKFKSKQLSDREKSMTFYDASTQRWSTDLQPSSDEDACSDYLQNVGVEVIRDKANFENASQIVGFLQKVPNFKIKLTTEQNTVVGQANNIVALGRSGTGKTTCAILRLFAMEILFKYRMTLAKIKHEEKINGLKFNADDVDSALGLRCIFVTASPVLSNEVQRYYQKLTGQVKDELKKKQERLLEKRRLEKKEQPKREEVEIQDSRIERGEADEALKLAEEGIKDLNIESLGKFIHDFS